MLLILLVLTACKQKVLKDVAYGDHHQQTFDAWVPKGKGPFPLIVYIHGGGFEGGDKEQVDQRLVKQALDKEVAFVSLNYRFLEHIPLQQILRDDIAYAIQYIKHYSKLQNIDTNQIYVYGGSAGGGSALWLATHDDLKDPNNTDPVRRESTRVKAIGHVNSQFTYDFEEWRNFFFDSAMSLMSPNDDLEAYHFDDRLDLYSPEGIEIRNDLNMYAMLDKDDPYMIFITNQGEEIETGGNLLHHPIHAQILYRRSRELGHQSKLIHNQELNSYEMFSYVISSFLEMMGK